MKQIQTMKIELINDHYQTIPEAFKKEEISKLVNLVLEKTGSESFENKQINIKYASEEEIQFLNEKFYKKKGITNVLAFTNHLKFPDEEANLIGEIALCIKQIEREARIYKKAIETRLKHMVVHGVLHLLGFDHEEKKDQLEMEKLESDIISSCLGDRPY